MITNDQEYRATSVAVERFEQALARVQASSARRDPMLQRALGESIESELEILRCQLAAYEPPKSIVVLTSD